MKTLDPQLIHKLDTITKKYAEAIRNKIVEPDPLRALLVECGVSDPVVVAEPGTHPLNTPEDWWTIILGWGILADERRARCF